MSQQDNTLPQELIDTHLQAVLRAGGSNFSHYSMQKSKDDLRAAMRAGMLAGAHAIQHGAVAITIHDLSPSMVEGAVRDRLIDLGWTPPGVEWATDVHGHKLYPLGTIGERQEPVAWEVIQGPRIFYVSNNEFVRSGYDFGSFKPLFYTAPQPAPDVAMFRKAKERDEATIDGQLANIEILQARIAELERVQGVLVSTLESLKSQAERAGRVISADFISEALAAVQKPEGGDK